MPYPKRCPIIFFSTILLLFCAKTSANNFTSLSQSFISLQPSTSFKIGLISVNVNTLTHDNHVIHISSETYGTTISSLYAQFVKTVTSIIEPSKFASQNEHVTTSSISSIKSSSTLELENTSAFTHLPTDSLNKTLQTVSDINNNEKAILHSFIHASDIDNLYSSTSVSSSVLEPVNSGQSVLSLTPILESYSSSINNDKTTFFTTGVSHATLSNYKAQFTKTLSSVIDTANIHLSSVPSNGENNLLSGKVIKNRSDERSTLESIVSSMTGRFVVFPSRKKVKTFIETITTTITKTAMISPSMASSSASSFTNSYLSTSNDSTSTAKSIIDSDIALDVEYFDNDDEDNSRRLNSSRRSKLNHRKNNKINHDRDFDPDTGENIKLEDAIEIPGNFRGSKNHEARLQYGDVYGNPYSNNNNYNPYSNQGYSNAQPNYGLNPQPPQYEAQPYPQNDPYPNSAGRTNEENSGSRYRGVFGMRVSAPSSNIDDDNNRYTNDENYSPYQDPDTRSEQDLPEVPNDSYNLRESRGPQYEQPSPRRASPSASILPIGVPLKPPGNSDLYGRDRNVPPRRDTIPSSQRNQNQPPARSVQRRPEDNYNQPITRRPSATSRPNYRKQVLARQQSNASIRQRATTTYALNDYVPTIKSVEPSIQVTTQAARQRNTKRIVLNNNPITTSSQNTQPAFTLPTNAFPKSVFVTSAPQIIFPSSSQEDSFLLNLPKASLTITSIVSLIKTLPIRHGFKTSYATITTTAFSTSIIAPHQYEYTYNPTNVENLLTVFGRSTVDSTRVIDTLITTATLLEVKLVPIKIGFSVRTDTLTDTQVLTTLSTSERFIKPTFLFNSNLFQLNSPATPAQGTSYSIATHTILSPTAFTATKVVSLALHGKILLSTITETQTSDLTIVTTTLVPVLPTITQLPPSIVMMSSPPLQMFTAPAVTTQLTLSITDSNGDVTELVTDITIPGTVLSTRVRRDIVNKIVSTLVGDDAYLSMSTIGPFIPHALHPSPMGIPDITFSHQPSRSHTYPSDSNHNSYSSKSGHGHSMLSASFSIPETNIYQTHPFI